MNQGSRLKEGYPMTLEFHGAASAEILGRDSWTPLHAAEGGGPHYKKVSRVLKKAQQKMPTAALDGHGCTPEQWNIMSKRSTVGPRRRPLSAGPCPHRRPPLADLQRNWQNEGEAPAKKLHMHGAAGEHATVVSAVNSRVRQRLSPQPPLSP